METKHTPAPWKWDEGWGAIVALQPNGEIRQLVTPAWPILRDAKREEQEEQRANRELIAAAPDLLAACELVLSSLEHNLTSDYLPETKAALRAAIAKATGGAE